MTAKTAFDKLQMLFSFLNLEDMVFKSFTLLIFLCTVNLCAQGNIEIKISTNINSMSCACEEADFISGSGDTGNQKHFAVPIKSLDCSKRMVEKDLQKLFNSAVYPNINMIIKPIASSDTTMSMDVSIQIMEVTNSYLMHFNKVQKNGLCYLEGMQELSLSQFQIEPPTKALGMVRVNDTIHIKFSIPSQLAVNAAYVNGKWD